MRTGLYQLIKQPCILLVYQEISDGLQSSESSAATLPQDWQENFIAASFCLQT